MRSLHTAVVSDGGGAGVVSGEGLVHVLECGDQVACASAGGEDALLEFVVGGDCEPGVLNFLFGPDLGEERGLVAARPG
ncbi:hypothetical protein AADR41_24890 [Streptomyces sp. CLV115]|uniref:hypothetical protein n=1 Tax=Streptomyces sp. CLV115 TaxID=3138502 RepID=UPI00313C0F89